MKAIRKPWLLWLLAGLILFILSMEKWNGDPSRVIWSDAEGYHMYLPGVFLYDGFENMPTKTPTWPTVGEKTFTKFTYGVALMQLPVWFIFFLGSALLNLEFSGFGDISGTAVIISTIIYVILGLKLLYKSLCYRFPSIIAAFSVAFIFLGTNLYYYSIAESGMSHAYSFCLVAILLYLCDQLFLKERREVAPLIIFLLCLIILIRPTNGIVILFPLFYKGFSAAGITYLSRSLWEYKKLGLLSLFAGLLLFLPQMFYWYELKGEWLLFSYGGEGFSEWRNPHMLAVLMDKENGLLLYSPLLIAALVGLTVCAWKDKYQGRVILLIFIIATYIFGSWWDWNFGGAFGHRCYVEYYPLLSIPFAFMFERIFFLASRSMRVIGIAFIIMAVVFSIRMSYFYASPWDGPDWTWERYFEQVDRVFRIF